MIGTGTPAAGRATDHGAGPIDTRDGHLPNLNRRQGDLVLGGDCRRYAGAPELRKRDPRT